MAPSSVLIVKCFAILTTLTVVGCTQESNKTGLCKRLQTDYHLQISCGDTGIIPEGCDTFEGLKILEIKHCSSAHETFLVKTEYQEHLGRVKRLNLSRNSLHELRGTLGNLAQLRLIDLSHNELTTLDPRVFTGQVGLRYLDLSHNLLMTLDLSDTRTHKLQVLDLSHNRLQSIDVGPAFFNKLRMLDLSHNNIKNYSVSNTIRTQFPKLEMLELSYNEISGTILRSEVDVFKLNVTIDLSHNDISRLDMRMTTRDVMIAKTAFSSRSYTTYYRLNAIQSFATVMLASSTQPSMLVDPRELLLSLLNVRMVRLWISSQRRFCLVLFPITLEWSHSSLVQTLVTATTAFWENGWRSTVPPED